MDTGCYNSELILYNNTSLFFGIPQIKAPRYNSLSTGTFSTALASCDLNISESEYF